MAVPQHKEEAGRGLPQVPDPAVKRLAVGPPETLPLDVPPGGGTPQTPYPTFDVASKDKWALDWDEKTRQLVSERIHNVPPYRFFSPQEALLLEAVCARILPQYNRPVVQPIPIAPWIDDRLFKGEGRGYRYEDMPDDREVFQLGLAGFEQTAQVLHGASFLALTEERQREVVERVADGDPPGPVWKRLPPQRFFQELVSEVVTYYYAHPAAWSEIGFSGPASPRGHIRLSLGRRDP